jgi:hypothetical protein
MFHIDGTAPQDGQIFVFGSNLSGFHYGGAARAANEHFGAKWGQGIGFSGQSYAIPTLGEFAESPLSIEEIDGHIKDFADFVHQNKDLKFFVTRVGCVIAGFSDEIIAPIFRKHLHNLMDRVTVAESWAPFFSEV